jgi:hypothetical protein
MKVGDKIRITWSDGDVIEGTYLREERGYVVFVCSDGRQSVYNPDHVKSVGLISGSR